MLCRHRKPHHRIGFVLIELLAVIMVIAILIALLLPAVQQAREAARRTTCKNNLLQIGVALHNYQMAHLVLPSGTVNSKGPILNQPKGYHVSWVIQILPFLDERAAFHSYDFKFGVYATTNLKTANHLLPVLQCHSNPGRGYHYAGCHHDLEAPIDTNNSGVLFLNSSIREKDLKDGRSHTIFVGETVDGGILSWTSGTSSTLRNMGNKINDVDPNQPTFNQNYMYGDYGEYSFEAEHDDGVFENSGSLQADLDASKERSIITPEMEKLLLQVGGFSSFHMGGAHFCLGDGSVRFISQHTNHNILRNLANRDDGNLIGEY